MKDETLSIYDEFYAQHYDTLFDNEKYEWEMAEIKKRIFLPKNEVYILDACCGTGTHYFLLSKDYNLIGLDISKPMLEVAKQKNPAGSFVNADILDESVFQKETFTNIICMYAAIHYIKDLDKLFSNLYFWLKSEGVVCISVFDKLKLEPESQNWSLNLGDEALTQYKNFTYESRWIHKDNNFVKYIETFKFKDRDKTREHLFYIPPISKIIEIAFFNGFELLESVPLLPLGHGDESLLFFKKRS